MRNSPLMYLAAFLLALFGWIAAAWIGSTSWDPLETASVTRIDHGSKVEVPKNGVAFFTDIVQKRDVTCRAKPEGALDIKGAKFTLTNTDADRTWHLMSTTIEAKPGTYTVTCTPRDRSIDTAIYGYAALPDFHNASIGKGVGSIATLAAFILAGWTWWGRRNKAGSHNPRTV